MLLDRQFHWIKHNPVFHLWPWLSNKTELLIEVLCMFRRIDRKFMCVFCDVVTLPSQIAKVFLQAPDADIVQPQTGDKGEHCP